MIIEKAKNYVLQIWRYLSIKKDTHWQRVIFTDIKIFLKGLGVIYAVCHCFQ